MPTNRGNISALIGKSVKLQTNALNAAGGFLERGSHSFASALISRPARSIEGVSHFYGRSSGDDHIARAKERHTDGKSGHNMTAPESAFHHANWQAGGARAGWRTTRAGNGISTYGTRIRPAFGCPDNREMRAWQPTPLRVGQPGEGLPYGGMT